jgi:glutamate dehydrogenase (NADP+)
VKEVFDELFPFMVANKRYCRDDLIERLVIPERIISFRVPWRDEKGGHHI